MAALKCVCTQRYKDKYGRILKYVLKAYNGDTTIIEAEALKGAIASGKLEVTNLKFSADGKLIVDEPAKQVNKASENKKKADAKKPDNTDYAGYTKCTFTQDIYDAAVKVATRHHGNVIQMVLMGMNFNNNSRRDVYAKIKFNDKLWITNDDTLEKNIAVQVFYDGLHPSEIQKPLNIIADKKIRALEVYLPALAKIGKIKGKDIELKCHSYDKPLLLTGNIEANKLKLSNFENLNVLSNSDIIANKIILEFEELNIADNCKLTITVNEIEYKEYRHSTLKLKDDFISASKDNKVEFKTKFNSPAFRTLLGWGIPVTLLDPENQGLYDKMIKNSTKEKLISNSSSIIRIVESVYKECKTEDDLHYSNPDNGDLEIKPISDCDILIPDEMVTIYGLDYLSGPNIVKTYKNPTENFINTIEDLLPLNVTPLKSATISHLMGNQSISISNKLIFGYGIYRVSAISILDNSDGKNDTYLIIYKTYNKQCRLVHMCYFDGALPENTYYCMGNVSNETLYNGLDRIYSKINGVAKEGMKIDQSFSSLAMGAEEERNAANNIVSMSLNYQDIYFDSIKRKITRLGDNYLAYTFGTVRVNYEEREKVNKFSYHGFRIDRDFDINIAKQQIKQANTEAFNNSVLVKLLNSNTEASKEVANTPIEDGKTSVLWQLAMKYRQELQNLDIDEYCVDVSGVFRNTERYETYELFNNVSQSLIFDIIQLPMYEYCEGLEDRFKSSIFRNDFVEIRIGQTRSQKIGQYNIEGRFLVTLTSPIMGEISYVSYYDPLNILLLLKHIACGNRVINNKWIGTFFSTVESTQNVRGFCKKVATGCKDLLDIWDPRTDGYTQLRREYDNPMANMSFISDGYDMEAVYKGKPATLNKMEHLDILLVGIDNGTGRMYLVNRHCLIRYDSQWRYAAPYSISAVKGGLGRRVWAVEMCDRVIACIKDTEALLMLLKSFYSLSDHAFMHIIHNAHFSDEAANGLLAYQIINNGLGTVADYRKYMSHESTIRYANALLPYIGNEGELVYEDTGDIEITHDEIMNGYAMPTTGLRDYSKTSDNRRYQGSDGYKADINEDDFDLDEFI